VGREGKGDVVDGRGGGLCLDLTGVPGAAGRGLGARLAGGPGSPRSSAARVSPVELAASQIPEGPGPVGGVGPAGGAQITTRMRGARVC